MRRIFLFTAGFLPALALLGAPAGATPPGSVPKAPETSCGNYGTSVQFVNNPAEAARQARRQDKLVFLLHVSGNFEDAKFT